VWGTLGCNIILGKTEHKIANEKCRVRDVTKEACLTIFTLKNQAVHGTASDREYIEGLKDV